MRRFSEEIQSSADATECDTSQSRHVNRNMYVCSKKRLLGNLRTSAHFRVSASCSDFW